MIHPDRMFHRFIFLFVFNIKIGEIQNVKYLRTKQITKKERQGHIKMRCLWGSWVNSLSSKIIVYCTRG